MMGVTSVGGKGVGAHRDKRLTALQVRSLGNPGFYPDGHGLYLKVENIDSKRWVQRIVIRGKRRDLGLGSASLVSLANARETALENRRLARAGGDPTEAKRNARAVPTFDEARDKVIALREGGWTNPKHASQWRSSMERHVTPLLGAKRVSEVTKADVIQVMSAIWSSRPETARRIQQRLGQVFEWAKAHGHRHDNPADTIAVTFGKHDRALKRHHPSLPHAEVAAALAKVRASRAADVTKAVFEFIVLTAARSGEARHATWEEIDFDRALWTVPASRMKKRREHRVPLSDSAIAVLRRMNAMDSGNDLVFPAPHSQKSLSDVTISKLAKELELGAVPHGFRSSFRNWAAEETSHPPQVVEFALAHVVSDKAEAAYLRTDLLEKRRLLMQDWSDYIIG